MASRSPVHLTVDELVNVLCEAATQASAAEKALRVGNHKAAAEALQIVGHDVQRCAGVVPVALWECCRRADPAGARGMLSGGAGKGLLRLDDGLRPRDGAAGPLMGS